MATTGKIHLTEEKETLLIPLYGKAMDYRSKKSILKDKTASDIVEKVDIDFSKYKRGYTVKQHLSVFFILLI
jgi:O-methyltransferase involved in polyketide biosynthesis